MIWRSKKQEKADPKQDVTTRAAAPAAGKNPSGLAAEPPSAAGNRLRSEQAQRRAAIAIRRSLAFAQAVLLFMYSPRHKHLSLSDLEWVVLPALAAGQLRIGHTKAKKSDVSIPGALVSWASVSAEVDKRLSANLDAPIRLQPREWQSASNSVAGGCNRQPQCHPVNAQQTCSERTQGAPDQGAHPRARRQADSAGAAAQGRTTERCPRNARVNWSLRGVMRVLWSTASA